jgi:hypothetical protein
MNFSVSYKEHYAVVIYMSLIKFSNFGNNKRLAYVMYTNGTKIIDYIYIYKCVNSQNKRVLFVIYIFSIHRNI